MSFYGSKYSHWRFSHHPLLSLHLNHPNLIQASSGRHVIYFNNWIKILSQNTFIVFPLDVWIKIGYSKWKDNEMMRDPQIRETGCSFHAMGG